MNVEQQSVRSAVRWMWVARWTRNRLGDTAMFLVVVWLYAIFGIGEKGPLIAALTVVGLEFYSRIVLVRCIERVERLTPHTQRNRQLRGLIRLLGCEARYHAGAQWTMDFVQPIRIMFALTLGLGAVQILPGVVGTLILITAALYSFIALNLAAVRVLMGRWRYAKAVRRFRERFLAETVDE